MIKESELKAMSDVFDALQSLDSVTQTRVVEWVLLKLKVSPSAPVTTSAKRGPKPGSKSTGRKRGPKPGAKRKVKRGRPPGSKHKIANAPSVRSPRSKGRPRKASEA